MDAEKFGNDEEGALFKGYLCLLENFSLTYYFP